jgi:hypothetical protein
MLMRASVDLRISVLGVDVRFFVDVRGCGISTCDKRLQIWSGLCTIMSCFGDP